MRVVDSVFRKRVWADRRDLVSGQGLLWDGGAAGAAERSGAVPAPASTAAPAAGGARRLYLSLSENSEGATVAPFLAEAEPNEVLQVSIIVRSCRCKCQFCPVCGPALGTRERVKLLGRLKSWKGCFGITVTVDGSLFTDAEAAYRYVREKKLIRRLVQDLFKRGHLRSAEYYAVIEFQGEETGFMPHWHILVDSSFVPFGEIVEVWSRFRPESAESLFWREGVTHPKVTRDNFRDLLRPAFGSVRFSFKNKGAVSAHAAVMYATSYLVKTPAAGWPAWVLGFVGHIHRKQHSHNFWPECYRHDEMCFCDVCRGAAEVFEDEAATAAVSELVQAGLDIEVARRSFRRRTVGERIAACGEFSTVTERRVEIGADGKWINRERFVEGIPLPFRDVCLVLGYDPDSTREICVSSTAYGDDLFESGLSQLWAVVERRFSRSARGRYETGD